MIEIDDKLYEKFVSEIINLFPGKMPKLEYYIRSWFTDLSGKVTQCGDGFGLSYIYDEDELHEDLSGTSRVVRVMLKDNSLCFVRLPARLAARTIRIGHAKGKVCLLEVDGLPHDGTAGDW